mgnify:CR=1 FL=1
MFTISAEAELVLRKAANAGLIKYIPAQKTFEIKQKELVLEQNTLYITCNETKFFVGIEIMFKLLFANRLAI